MDFVISDVTTVDEDGEPLFEISKVQICQAAPKPESKEVRQTKYIKICYVPLCPNTSRSTPEKMFITIPVNPVRRRKWLSVVGKTSEGRNPKSPMFCCQDHFNLSKDMKNYEDYLERGKVQMVLYQTVVPHIFACNNYGHLKRNDRIEALRKLHQEIDFSAVEPETEPEVTLIRLTPQPRCIKPKKEVPKKTLFIELPDYQCHEQSDEYIGITEKDVDTIIIEDSD